MNNPSNNSLSQPLIRLENVSFHAKLASHKKVNLQGQAILQDITFTIPQSARICIVGASGSGKSFLLRLLNRLIEPTQGQIYWQNQPYSQISPLELRQRVGLTPQVPKLLGMSVEAALTYPLKLRQLDKDTIQQRLESCLQTLKIPDDWRQKNELQLSTGQIQLVAIARTLMMQSSVLLLDEPTAHLDPTMVNHLLQVLNDLVEQQNTTIVMVSHHIEQVEQFLRTQTKNTQTKNSDVIAQLQNGRIINRQIAAEIDWEKLKQNIAQTNDEFAF